MDCGVWLYVLTGLFEVASLCTDWKQHRVLCIHTFSVSLMACWVLWLILAGLLKWLAHVLCLWAGEVGVLVLCGHLGAWVYRMWWRVKDFFTGM